MEKEMTLKILKWIRKNFENYNFSVEEHQILIGTEIKISMYDTNEGWEEHSLFFDKKGNMIINYEKIEELKKQLEKIQKQIKELEQGQEL